MLLYALFSSAKTCRHALTLDKWAVLPSVRSLTAWQGPLWRVVPEWASSQSFPVKRLPPLLLSSSSWGSCAASPSSPLCLWVAILFTRDSFHPPKLCKQGQFKCLKRPSCSCAFSLNVSMQSKTTSNRNYLSLGWTRLVRLYKVGKNRVFLRHCSSHICQNVCHILDLFTEPGWFLASLKWLKWNLVDSFMG